MKVLFQAQIIEHAYRSKISDNEFKNLIGYIKSGNTVNKCILHTEIIIGNLFIADNFKAIEDESKLLSNLKFEKFFQKCISSNWSFAYTQFSSGSYRYGHLKTL